MSHSDLNKKVRDLRELRLMASELDAMIESVQDEVKAEMTAQNTDTLIGDDWKITWKTITSSRIDATALREVFPDIAERFSKVTSYKRFNLS